MPAKTMTSTLSTRPAWIPSRRPSRICTPRSAIPRQLAQLKALSGAVREDGTHPRTTTSTIDQGIYSRLRVSVQIRQGPGRAGILRILRHSAYDEIRTATADTLSRELVKTRRAEMDAARKLHPRSGTALPPSGGLSGAYKSLGLSPEVRSRDEGKGRENPEISKTVLKGIPAVPASGGHRPSGVRSSELDTVKEGEILVCKMTNPAGGFFLQDLRVGHRHRRRSVPPRRGGREFGSRVVGTRATQLIKTGDKIRVDGSIGVVEVLSGFATIGCGADFAPQSVSPKQDASRHPDGIQKRKSAS